MAIFEVLVREIETPVEHHPKADRLSIIRMDGFLCISNKLEDGSHRYKVGDKVVYVPEGAVVPETLLRRGFWDEQKDKGILAGKKGNRVKCLRLREIVSQGILFPVVDKSVEGIAIHDDTPGTDVTADLGIIKYEEPIPEGMSGEVFDLHGLPDKYDFDSIQKVTDLFEKNMEVVVSEKLHGSFLQIGFVPNLSNDELFGDAKNIYVCSKGLGSRGLVFKNNEANDNNLYVRALRAMLADGLEKRLADIQSPLPIRLFGEIFGKGVQDLSYGADKPQFRLFDMKIGERFVSHGTRGLNIWADKIGVQAVPELYSGPFDTEILEGFRDGKDTLSGSHMREGIVIRASDEANHHPDHGRRIAKWVSPEYLLRKNGTEHQ